jgi:hypothetical protein
MAAAMLFVASAIGAQTTPEPVTVNTDSLPFSVGERLAYRVTSGKFGATGRAVMSVEGPVDVRGTPTWLLRSEMHARVGFVKASGLTESWLDPTHMTALRFHKRERRAFRGSDAQVEIFPEGRRWEVVEGKAGVSPSEAPLDELSFIYFVRTLALESDALLRVDRHYDAGRNPVHVRVTGRDSVVTDAGVFRTIVVEMRVKDPGHYEREGTIQIHLSDDASRLPVRIESTVSILGKIVLTLESWTLPGTPLLAYRPS